MMILKRNEKIGYITQKKMHFPFSEEIKIIYMYNYGMTMFKTIPTKYSSHLIHSDNPKQAIIFSTRKLRHKQMECITFRRVILNETLTKSRHDTTQFLRNVM
jgi:hypothetical protein